MLHDICCVMIALTKDSNLPSRNFVTCGPRESTTGVTISLRVGQKVTLRTVLENCYKLDAGGLDHGELSRISKHAIIGLQR